MKGAIRTIARKELRSSFLSPIALIFLGVFLVGTLFIFFTYSKFFVRNLADVRPLFSWLPVLLIFLVSAVTMRQWSEEQKMGTLEILLTLPLRTRDLVLGKFAAGMALVAVALLLTLPLPITVSMLGELDWGPVLGGYVAALLVAGMYMAIGLCVSARTDNQIVALMVTALVCSALYFIGSDSVAGLVGADAGNVLRGLGSGSRFLSIERGVLDLRDLAYYLSLTGFFLVLNVQFLELKRLEGQPGDGKTRRPAMLLTIGLAALNTVALNLWLAPVTKARADLTADGEYSISDVTTGVLAGLNEPLEITGYFSEKTHPLLAPLVPRLKDFLSEYQVRGGGKVTVSFVEPTAEIEEEIDEQYGIKSVPFRISGQNEEAVVNSYFHVLVRYGSEYEVLSFQDLIEIHADDNDVQVRLRNAEYDVTRAIKKVSQGFESLESVLARNNQQAKLTAYISPAEKLPAEFKEVPDRLKKVADALGPKRGGRFSFEIVNPDGNAALQQDILARYRFQPMAVDPFSEDRFFMHLLLQTGDHAEQIFPQGGLSEADLRTAIEAAIKRGTPGFLKTIGLYDGGAGGRAADALGSAPGNPQ
ncbi:MAG: Gldg family protein [bacterium]